MSQFVTDVTSFVKTYISRLPPRQYIAWRRKGALRPAQVIKLAGLVFLLHTIAMVTARESQWAYIECPWATGDEMTTLALRRAKKYLVDGGAMYLKTEVNHVTRYARVLQGHGAHGRTIHSGSSFSVQIDETGNPLGKLPANPFGVSLRLHQKVFVSRIRSPRDVYPSVSGFFLEEDIPGIAPTAIEEGQLPTDSINVQQNDTSPPKWSYFNFSYWYEWTKWLVADGRNTPTIVALGGSGISQLANLFCLDIWLYCLLSGYSEYSICRCAIYYVVVFRRFGRLVSLL